MSAILAALVDDGITAMNGKPSSAAKYASDTAVDPDDASMTVVFSSIQPLHSAYRNSDRASRCLRLPVMWVVSSLRYSCTSTAVAPRHRQRIAQQMGVGAAPGVGLDQPDRVVHPLAWLAATGR